MGKPLPEALRARFQDCIEEDLSGRAASKRMKVSAATGSRWLRAIRQTGKVEALRQGRPPGHGKLAPHRAFFEELIDQDGDITLPELAAALLEATGVSAHSSSIGRFLRKCGFTYKKSH